jgi:hypothetical protein
VTVRALQSWSVLSLPIPSLPAAVSTSPSLLLAVAIRARAIQPA